MYCLCFKRLKVGVLAIGRVGVLAFLLVGLVTAAQAREGGNRILSVDPEEGKDGPAVTIRTEEPVGYRYTVYSSSDPERVVIDFPGMDVSGVETPIPAANPPLEEIRLSSFDLTSGELGRVELFLTRASDFDVEVSEKDFRISFSRPGDSDGEETNQEEQAAAEQGEAPVAGPNAAEPVTTPEVSAAMDATGRDASMFESVDVQDGEARLVADGSIGRYRYFSLGAPPRLVVDAYGIRPGFEERSFTAADGFRKIRVGAYEDKTRFVFDADGDRLPEYAVEKQENVLAVNWGEKAGGEPRSAPVPEDVPVTIESIDFDVDAERSVLTIDLSGDPQTISPKADGDIVRFGIRNANISRALRRSIDASAFPGAVRMITPYLVQAGDTQEVRFVVELKGPVDYDLQTSGSRVLFSVDNGPFAEPAPAARERMGVVVPELPKPAAAGVEERTEALAASAPTPEGRTLEPVKTVEADEPHPAYSGEKITLVFDDADVRRIFRLIAEVSDLNLLVGDEVKGNISLRLIDVPWDQALDLILDIKNLGMLREGNVVRILPRGAIREMRQAELTAVKQERDLEPLTTEVIGVSYTSLENITAPASELLTDRGNITPDGRNKQLIVTDIPDVLEEVKRLVAILDTPEKQVMIEARIVEANTNFNRDLGVSWNLLYTDDAEGNFNNLSEGEVSGGGNFIINPGVGSAGIGSSFTFGRVGVTSTVLDLRLSAAENAGQSKVISKPRVSTLNGEAAIISQGTQIPYQTVSDQGTQTEFVDATLELNVTPIINPDDSIILEIKATNNTPTTVAGATAPGINKKEATTKVLVQNGETTVIGGIFTESKSDSETGIPLLRKLPIVGHLFKSTNKTDDRSELLIFITPRILD